MSVYFSFRVLYEDNGDGHILRQAVLRNWLVVQASQNDGHTFIPSIVRLKESPQGEEIENDS